MENDLIRRKDAYDSLLNGMVMTGYQSRALDCIAEYSIPAVDAVPVVRCKDCIWWGAERFCENSDSTCFQNGCTHGNWFCADGERMSK